MSNQLPIILLMGPSGTGKTTFADNITQQWGFIHHDFDQWEGDTEVVQKLRSAWEAYKKTGDASEFRKNIEEQTDPAAGVVLSFPSDDMVVDVPMLERAKLHNIHPVILFAEAERCKEVFSVREKTNGRGLPIEHWSKYNEHIYEPGFLTQAHDAYVIKAFDGQGDRKSEGALLAELQEMID